MTGFNWQPHGNGLLFREDDFSWQGAHSDDEHFYLRRSKDHPHTMTDVLLGKLDVSEAAGAFSQFLTITGGLNNRLLLTAFANNDENYDLVVAKFDKLTGTARRAIELSHSTVANTLLQPNGMNWDAIIELE